MGEKFCLPVSFNKKLGVYELIKDLEGNGRKNITKEIDSIRNSVLPPLKEFISHNNPLTIT